MKRLRSFIANDAGGLSFGCLWIVAIKPTRKKYILRSLGVYLGISIKKAPKQSASGPCLLSGGGSRDRTGDLLNAIFRHRKIKG